GLLSKAFVQSIICLGLSAAPAAGAAITGCMPANDSLAAATPPAYERLSLDAAFGTANRLLSRSLPGMMLAQPAAASVGFQGKPCRLGVSVPSIASSSPRRPA